MDDVITDAPPPSRFLLEDLNNFIPPPPALPSPFLVLPATDSKKTFAPSLLIVAISSPSLHFLHHLSSKIPVGTLVLPELTYAGNSVESSLRNKSCSIYALNNPDKLIMVALVQFPVTPERAHSVAKLLVGDKIIPQRVLILDSIKSCNFRGRLSPDESIAFKLETSLQRKNSDAGDPILKGLDYFPSGSIVDGLAAALLSRCQLQKVKGTLCVSWPDFGVSVMSLVKSLLVKDVLPDVNCTIDGGYKDGYLSLSRRRERIDSDLFHASEPPLTLDNYKSNCPNVLDIIRKEMEFAVLSDPRNAALILRLHFHDCFVQGCDGSVLLDDTITLQGEKRAPNNINALKGFGIIDRIKNRLESECPGIVSCADILTVAARDAVLLVGGPYWDVPLGRYDSKTAGYALTETNIPKADDGLFSIITKFLYQGLSTTDMVALSGAHTIGMSRCVNFRRRVYGDFAATSGSNPVSQQYLSSLRSVCPPVRGSSDNNESAMDYVTPNLFDNSYYQILLRGQGLMNSDQELYSSVFAIETKKIVEKYAENPIAFFEQFSESMVKMGNITNRETYVDGEVRKNCRFVNM